MEAPNSILLRAPTKLETALQIRSAKSEKLVFIGFYMSDTELQPNDHSFIYA